MVHTKEVFLTTTTQVPSHRMPLVRVYHNNTDLRDNLLCVCVCVFLYVVVVGWMLSTPISQLLYGTYGKQTMALSPNLRERKGRPSTRSRSLKRVKK